VLGHVAALSQWTVFQTIHRGSGLIHSTSSGDDGVTGAAAADLFLQARGSDAVTKLGSIWATSSSPTVTSFEIFGGSRATGQYHGSVLNSDVVCPSLKVPLEGETLASGSGESRAKGRQNVAPMVQKCKLCYNLVLVEFALLRCCII
jgi:hypothetical protein